MTTETTTSNHPTSGETYAVRIVDGVIIRAAGPLHYNDPTDEDSLADVLDNNRDTAAEDGAWLQAAIDKANGNVSTETSPHTYTFDLDVSAVSASDWADWCNDEAPDWLSSSGASDGLETITISAPNRDAAITLLTAELKPGMVIL